MPSEMSRCGVSTRPSVNSSSASPRSIRPADHGELGVAASARAPAPRPRAPPSGRNRRAAARPAGGRPSAARRHRCAGRCRRARRWRSPRSSPGGAGSRWRRAGSRSAGSAPSRPPNAPESSSDREPACSPLPETSTTATWSDVPSRGARGDQEVAGERRAAGRAEHRLGVPVRRAASGIRAWLWIRSRRSTSIDSPRDPGDAEPGPPERRDQDDQPDQEDHHDAADPPAVEQARGGAPTTITSTPSANTTTQGSVRGAEHAGCRSPSGSPAW